VLATVGLAAASSLAAGASPLVGAKRALFVVGWLAVGLVSLAAWRRANGARAANSPTDVAVEEPPPGGNGTDRQGRADGGRTRRFDRSVIQWRLLVAGSTALAVSILLEVGFGIGG
jgi:hypothetical protein